ncbi:uncharacterized protein K452DRAFT_221209 [Aplosporella prunicola CBS 121167]|uniref:Complex 1 LYR protein domain-containing protein n=1 Tax=Aplosporella prunicola CBS 121167 TaxID=1176127 RepID=A0A6A6BQW7_9PEZI|nr:uncharacterized protein K452DRAFT_221209 [Aplosporella prunicola CBS 121167]KAF2145823.1 hypothetical protein K452DRAFT_221209 [Aplosporella prunicola CBS 121167]
MPKFLVPKQSSQHRVAAIALYRALLTQCAAVPLPDEQRTALANIARNKFRKTANMHSTPQLKLAFSTGYEALKLLDRLEHEADTKAKTEISELLALTPHYLTRTPMPRHAQPPRDFVPEATLPAGQRFLETRPRAQVSGRRRVPVLVNANKFPFLRSTKPQPRSLSRILTYRIKQRQGWMDTLGDSAELAALAKEEDHWDSLVDEMDGVEEEEDDQPNWGAVPREVTAHVGRKLQKQKEKSMMLAHQMQEIVLKERELAAKEKREKWLKKKEERLARREARLKEGSGEVTNE